MDARWNTFLIGALTAVLLVRTAAILDLGWVLAA